MKDFNGSLETIELLEENIDHEFHDISLGKLLDLTPNTRQ